MRRQGNTFRLLLQSIIYASSGNNVVYQTRIHALKKYYFEKCLDIIFSYISTDNDTVTFNKQQYEIRFSNGGKINFICIENNYYSDRNAEYFRGRKIDNILSDD